MTMTEEEIARAHAEYDALPGTPSDRAAFHTIANDDDASRIIGYMAAQLGGVFYRATKTDAGVWVEAWDHHPRKQADFDETALRARTGLR